MDSPLKLVILVCGLAIVGTILWLLKNRKISERNSLFWLVGSVCVFTFSSFPQLLDDLARFVGIQYPPSLLFLLAVLILLVISLNQSIQVSVLNAQMKELTQHVAIHEEEKGD